MNQFKVALFAAFTLSVLLAAAAPVLAQTGESGGGVGAAAPSAEVYEYFGSPPSEEPVVVENGEIRTGYDVFVSCQSDYRVLGGRQSRACYEAGYTPLNYPGPAAKGPFSAYPGPGGTSVSASPTELPDTGGAASPAFLGAGALAAGAGILFIRGARMRADERLERRA